MSKKKKGSPANRRTARYRPEAPPPPANPLDRLANWLNRRSRFVRILFAGAIAAIWTGSSAILVFSILLNMDPDRIVFGPVNATNIFLVMTLALSVAGFGTYWVGWRLLVGFGFSDAPHKAGRGAAIWVLGALALTVFISMLMLASTMQALGN